MSTDTENANEVYKELVSKLETAKGRRESAKATAKEKAFPAHANADAKARKDLDRLNVEAATAAVEVENLEAAVAEARKRVDHAAALSTDEAERDEAQTALALLAGFSARGERLDSAISKFCAEYAEMERDCRALQQLGYPPSTLPLVQANMKRATQAALMGIGIESDFLPPHERRNFVECVDGWAQSVRGRIEARLRRNPPKREAA